MSAQVYERITERIIAMLEQGIVPWHKPWDARVSLPRNLVSKQGYRGINVLLLLSLHYRSPYWLTYRQATQLGGNVRKGEKACPVVFWKQTIHEDADSGDEVRVPLLRYYYVFNLAQCEGLAIDPAPVTEETGTADWLGQAEKIVVGMPQCPVIRHGLARAFYSPRVDTVSLPDRNQFDNTADYFATLFHELVHATGHATRLNRPAIVEIGKGGTELYGKEELLAEIGASFLCGQAGILERTINNSAAYLSHWLERFRQDTRLIVQASAQAQRAVDFILSVGRQSDTIDRPETTDITNTAPDQKAA